MIHTSSLFVDGAGLIRPDLIPLAAFLCAEEYGTYARSIILDHAAAGAPLEILTHATPDGWVILEPFDLAAAEEALRRGGPAPRVSSVVSARWSGRRTAVRPGPTTVPRPPTTASRSQVPTVLPRRRPPLLLTTDH
jgi:hypothetical protein